MVFNRRRNERGPARARHPHPAGWPGSSSTSKVTLRGSTKPGARSVAFSIPKLTVFGITAQRIGQRPPSRADAMLHAIIRAGSRSRQRSLARRGRKPSALSLGVVLQEISCPRLDRDRSRPPSRSQFRGVFRAGARGAEASSNACRAGYEDLSRKGRPTVGAGRAAAVAIDRALIGRSAPPDPRRGDSALDAGQRRRSSTPTAAHIAQARTLNHILNRLCLDG